MEKIWLKNYPKGVPDTIDLNQYQSIIDVFEQSCEQFSDKPAFANMGHTITFNELNTYSKQFASTLQHEFHLTKGDRIAIMMPNLLQYPIALFGAL